MIAIVAIVAGGLGAVARWWLAGRVRGDITTVNIVGSALLGLAVGLEGSGRLSSAALTVIGVGFLGGFTTFSTWMAQTIVAGGEAPGPRRVILVPVVAGLLAVIAGRWLGSIV